VKKIISEIKITIFQLFDNFQLFLEFSPPGAALPFEKHGSQSEMARKDAAHDAGHKPMICLKLSIMNLQRIRVFPSENSWFLVLEFYEIDFTVRFHI
jgi:hypothetical protein